MVSFVADSSAINSRLTSMTYPNGRVLTFNYNTGVDNTISRLSSISDTGNTLESYKYLGLDTVVDTAKTRRTLRELIARVQL